MTEVLKKRAMTKATAIPTATEGNGLENGATEYLV